MSEQTPDTNNAMSDGQDPSMEDILASIRKIIADDDVQSEASSLDEGTDLQTANGDLSDLAHVDTLDLDIIADEPSVPDADIEALIGDVESQSSSELDIPELETIAMVDEASDDVLDLEIPMDEPELTVALDETEALDLDASLDFTEEEPEEPVALEDELADLIDQADEEIITKHEEPKPSRGLMGGAMAALGLGGAAAASKASSMTNDIGPPDDDLSLMLDNMLEDSAVFQEEAAEDLASEELVIDPAEDLLADIDIPDEATAKDPDMDLVKSLMADLTEEPLHEEEVEAATVDIDDDVDVSSDDVMDEILSMTLDDETKISEEIAIPELDTRNADEGLSLKEIAAAAEADAQSSDSGLGIGLAAVAGLGAVGIAAATQDDEAETDAAETDDIDEALSQFDELLGAETNFEDLNPETPEPHAPESNLEETPEMARAKKTDAIIDEVTETATAGAFASLTNVVENKAVTAERGDRIGDLVMEALQPMLKEWLDANLKGIVERAVTKEVKRISSGK